MSGKFGDVINNHIMKNNQQLTSLHSTLTESIQQIKGLLQVKCLETDPAAQIVSKLSSFQSTLHQQLSNIESQFLCEIKKLGDKLYKQLKYSAEKETTEQTQSIYGVSSVTVQPDLMKKTSLNFTNPHVSSVRTGNNSVPATTCAQVNTTMHRLSANISDNKSSGYIDNNGSDKHLQMYQQGLQNCHKHLSAITDSNVNETVLTSTSHEGSVMNSRCLAQSAKVPENFLEQHAVYCHPFAQCELSFTLKSGPSPVAAIVPQSPVGSKNINIQYITPKQAVTQPEGFSTSPKPEKTGKRKRIFNAKKKPSSSKYVENMTVIHTEAKNSSHTRRWTRSQYKLVKETQAAPQDDFQQENGWQFVDDPKYSKSNRQNKIVTRCSNKRDTSVYDFQESDTCNIPLISRKRNHVSNETMGNMSLASFLNNGCVERRKDRHFQSDSVVSSPTISITEMTIRRKVRTPFRRPLGKDALSKPDHDTMKRQSPAPTLLSEIGSKM